MILKRLLGKLNQQSSQVIIKSFAPYLINSHPRVWQILLFYPCSAFISKNKKICFQKILEIFQVKYFLVLSLGLESVPGKLYQQWSQRIGEYFLVLPLDQLLSWGMKSCKNFFFTVSILEYKKTFFRKYKKLFWVWFFCLEKVPGRQKPTVIPTYKGYIKFFIFNLVSICVRVYKFFYFYFVLEYKKIF